MPVLFVRKPWCHYLRDGVKTVELRLAIPKYDRWGVGTVLSINYQFQVKIVEKLHFDNIAACLEAISPRDCGFTSVEHGVQVWESLYPRGLEDPVLAFRVSRIK